MELLRKIFVKYRACLCKTEQWITQKHDVHSAYIPGSFTLNTTLLCGVYEKQTTNQNKTYGHVTNQNAEIQTTWLVMSNDNNHVTCNDNNNSLSAKLQELKHDELTLH